MVFNVIVGDFGDDVLTGTIFDDCIIGYDGNDKLYGDFGEDVLTGGKGRDSLFGNFQDDTLDGGEGDDLLDGGEGADDMGGGSGDDIYVVDNSGDQVFEVPDEGIDTVKASITYWLPSNVENLTLTGATPSMEQAIVSTTC